MVRWLLITLAVGVLFQHTAAQDTPTLPLITAENADRLTRIARIDTGSQYASVQWLPGSSHILLVQTAGSVTAYDAISAVPVYSFELASQPEFDAYRAPSPVILTDGVPVLWYQNADGTFSRWNSLTGEALPPVDPVNDGFEGINEWDEMRGGLREINGETVYEISARERLDNDFGARIEVAYWDPMSGRLLARYSNPNFDLRVATERDLPGWEQHLNLLPAADNVWAAELAVIDNEMGEVTATHVFDPLAIYDILASRDGSTLAVLNGDTLHLLERDTLVQVASVPFGASYFTNTTDYLRRVPGTDLILVRGAGFDDTTWSLLDMNTGTVIPLSNGIWEGFQPIDDSSDELQAISFERFNAREYQNWALLGPAGERVAYDSTVDPLFFDGQTVLDEDGEPIVAEARVYVSDTDGTLIASLPLDEIGLPQVFSSDDRLLLTYYDQWDIPDDEFVILIDTSTGDIVDEFALEPVPNTSDTFSERDNLPAGNFQFSPDGVAIAFTYGGTMCCGGELGNVIVEWWGVSSR